MDIIIEFMRSTAGLLAGIAGLFIAIVAMMKELRRWLRMLKEWLDKHVRGRSTVDADRARHRTPKKKILTVLLLLAFTVTIFTVQVAYPLPLNVKLTNKAWRAYNKENYRSAIDYADECFEEFKMTADSLQSDLNELSVALPPTGEVLNNDIRKEIFARGPLNDVATCYWIKGRSAEKLGDKDKARDAYLAATEYPHARCWDSRGWFQRGIFWSPPADARGRLKNLKQ